MKHTPGPWIYDAGAFYAQCQLNEYGMTRESPIAEMLDGREGDYKANARLIAAAPDLLEALEMVRDADNDNGRKIPPLARAKIDAAIAKATGNE